MNDNVKLVENQNERNSRINILEAKVLEQAESNMLLERKLEVQLSCNQCKITKVELSELKKHNETFALLISRLMCTNCSQRFENETQRQKHNLTLNLFCETCRICIRSEDKISVEKHEKCPIKGIKTLDA